ncbi:MAG: ATP-binding protein, partial [Anaerolineae bacterium]
VTALREPAKPASWVKITVADRGPGVPADFQAQAFQPFAHSRAAASSVRHGAGLGLSVVKAIVEAHGGQVGLTDRPGGGSVFWFTLPVADYELRITDKNESTYR